MTLSQKMEYFSQMDEEKSKVIVLKDRQTKFQDLLNQWGYKSPTEFLIECEFITNPSVKKTRTVISKEVRQNIVTDLNNKVPTKDISSKYGVTDDTVYKIKGEEKLTKPKTKKVPTTTTVTVPTPTTDNPTTVPTPTVTVSPTTDNPSTVPTTTVSDSEKTLTPSVV
jgi:transposase-like protein